ncbi:MAG: isoleucine--tRNA ligase [Candidatus Kapaibacterium sp.]
MFNPLPEKISYPELEENILDFWETSGVFQQSLEQRERENAPWFNFYEGPPTANGAPGIHHVMARTLKDLVCRYKTMRGYYVRRQAGWDTHGLPVEIAVSKQLNLVTRDDIAAYGIDRYNKACRDLVNHHITMQGGWRTLTRRMGYWVDMDSAYITCTNEYIESVWWALKQYFDKGLIYKGFKVVPQSPTIETPLSSHELSLGYKEVRDPNVYLRLRITESPRTELNGASILVWTTTPWTLFANVALAVGENIEYAHVRVTTQHDGNEQINHYVLATSRLSILDGTVEVLSTFSGKEILGSRYEAIFPDVELDLHAHPNALSIVHGDFVSTEDGSGVVHLAPAFGTDDFDAHKKYNLPMPVHVTPNGHFKEIIKDFAGRAIKTFTYADGSVEEGSDKDIIIALKKAGKILKSSMDYLHNYPHCWRTGNPVMYYARDSWFISSPKYRERMIELNKTITWQPEEIGSGRFGNWLDDVKDWSLSRDRFWGTPLPIWVSEDGSDAFAVGSIEELMEGFYLTPGGARVPVAVSDAELDLHRPFVDNIVFERNGKTYKRVSEVIDVWFDSGSMPFAQFHYPFENKELFEKSFPADFIAEGIDQTRGWFYTLHNIGTAVFDKPAYRSVVVNELVLDKDGKKMSKSLGNTVDPFAMMNTYGADALRWYFMVSNPPWKPTRFAEKDIADTVIADFFRSLTNTYAFFALYANVDGFTGTEPMVPVDERPEIDRWILSALHSLRISYCTYMDAYDITRAARAVQDFVRNDVSNWYVRRNRRRFWKGENDADKTAAYQTLRTVLMDVSELIAPIAPFLAEELYQRLAVDGDISSVHLRTLHPGDGAAVDADLERRMAAAQRIVFLARSLREKSKIKTRQPLQRILVPVMTPQQRRDIQAVESLICEEINVKGIEYVTDDVGIVRRSAKANFKSMGKKAGKNMKAIADIIRTFTNDHVRILQRGEFVPVTVENETYSITLEDVEILSEDIEGWLVASEGDTTVALDTELTPALVAEGHAREFVNRVQNLRKKAGLEVTDRVVIRYSTGSDVLRSALQSTSEYICTETLATALEHHELTDGEATDINELDVVIQVEKA